MHYTHTTSNTILHALLIFVMLCNSGTLSKFAFKGDGEDSEPVTVDASMTKADFRGKSLGPSGAIMAAAFLPKW
jgi:hypothetical protein